MPRPPNTKRLEKILRLVVEAHKFSIQHGAPIGLSQTQIAYCLGIPVPSAHDSIRAMIAKGTLATNERGWVVPTDSGFAILEWIDSKGS